MPGIMFLVRLVRSRLRSTGLDESTGWSTEQEKDLCHGLTEKLYSDYTGDLIALMEHFDLFYCPVEPH